MEAVLICAALTLALIGAAVPAEAASKKTINDTFYSDVFVSGNYAYYISEDTGKIIKINISEGRTKVISDTYIGKRGFVFDTMRLYKGYLYLEGSEFKFNLRMAIDPPALCRVSADGGKLQYLCEPGRSAIAMKGSRIYFRQYRNFKKDDLRTYTRSMKLNGKGKRNESKVKVKTSWKKSNKAGYNLDFRPVLKDGIRPSNPEALPYVKDPSGRIAFSNASVSGISEDPYDPDYDENEDEEEDPDPDELEEYDPEEYYNIDIYLRTPDKSVYIETIEYNEIFMETRHHKTFNPPDPFPEEHE